MKGGGSGGARRGGWLGWSFYSGGGTLGGCGNVQATMARLTRAASINASRRGVPGCLVGVYGSEGQQGDVLARAQELGSVGRQWRSAMARARTGASRAAGLVLWTTRPPTSGCGVVRGEGRARRWASWAAGWSPP